MSNTYLNADGMNCCGCSACADICPKNAISIIPDDNGFSVPSIDESLCVDCKMCQKVCQYINPVDLSKPIESYAAACSNSNAIMTSASGGVFYAIAEQVLKQGGAVAGCAYDKRKDKLTVKHILIQDGTELYRLQGSKYVQSDTVGIYKEIKKIADTNRTVLFTGTPCQVAACRKYLGNRYDNVFYIDIICHGVPSLSMFNKYISYQEKKQNIKIDKLIFRDKSKGWDLKGSLLYRKNGQTYSKTFKTGGCSYYALFLQSKTYRDSCYECKYAKQERCSDLTIGDYWGIDSQHPEYLMQNGGTLDKNKGISCILVNSKKGKELLERFGNGLEMLTSTFEKVAKSNTQLREPSKKGAGREEVLNILNTKGYEEVEKWYYDKMGIKKYIYKAYNCLPAKKI